MSDTLVAPELVETPTDPTELTHIVNQALPGNGLADAMIFGTEVVAMCGYRFIPMRDPHKYPVCMACREALTSWRD